VIIYCVRCEIIVKEMMKTKRRIYMEGAALAAGAVVSPCEEHAHYLVTVLRLGTGDAVHLFNAECGEWLGEIQNAKKSDVKILIQSQTRPALSSPAYHLTLAFAPLKKDRTDFLVEKASELGAHVLQPVFTDHTQSERVNTDRLQITAVEAAQQCDRLDAPQVLAPVKLQNYLHDLPEDATLFLAAERGDAIPIAEAFFNLSSPGPCAARSPGIHGAAIPNASGNRETPTVDPRALPQSGSPESLPRTCSGDDKLKQVHFLIGPEGGFSEKEFTLFDRYVHNIRRIRLGPRLLRAETAAVSVLSAFQAIAGDWTIMPD
jgi:16S rRNA (uracil1498-N3)-methyltransferase